MTFDEVDDQLTLPRYNALQRFWIKHPPTPILLAHYVGYKAQQGQKETTAVNLDDAEIEEMDEESMEQLAAIFGRPVRAQ